MNVATDPGQSYGRLAVVVAIFERHTHFLPSAMPATTGTTDIERHRKALTVLMVCRMQCVGYMIRSNSLRIALIWVSMEKAG